MISQLSIVCICNKNLNAVNIRIIGIIVLLYCCLLLFLVLNCFSNAYVSVCVCTYVVCMFATLHEYISNILLAATVGFSQPELIHSLCMLLTTYCTHLGHTFTHKTVSSSKQNRVQPTFLYVHYS